MPRLVYKCNACSAEHNDEQGAILCEQKHMMADSLKCIDVKRIDEDYYKLEVHSISKLIKTYPHKRFEAGSSLEASYWVHRIQLQELHDKIEYALGS